MQWQHREDITANVRNIFDTIYIDKNPYRDALRISFFIRFHGRQGAYEFIEEHTAFGNLYEEVCIAFRDKYGIVGGELHGFVELIIAFIRP